MTELRYTLVSDGSSDRALLPLITWCLRRGFRECGIQPEWADLQRLPRPPQSLPEKIVRALELYPCDVLFIHRDAERCTHGSRVKEIRNALQDAGADVNVPAVCVVPVRMMEAWLLFDESALRNAAGNPSGTRPLSFPSSCPEAVPNPKQVLHDLLREASELTGRRRKRFRADVAVHRLAHLIKDFSPLNALPSFQALQAEIAAVTRRVR